MGKREARYFWAVAGVYLHIPYCRQACHYCDFHFSTRLETLGDLMDALLGEMELRSRESWAGKVPETVYFGGGTPSLLPARRIGEVMDRLHGLCGIAEDAEITLEANPDDISPANLREWMSMGINRLSIGIQSFDAGELKFMNRIHTASQAESAVKRAQDAGLVNLTIDLIYGVPHSAPGVWEGNLAQAIRLDVPHISAYCLTIEHGTYFGHRVRKGLLEGISDAEAERQYLALCEVLQGAGYEHYEVSNFARPGAYSRHNSGYWGDQPYAGFGPGAHSYDGASRSWNVRNNPVYIRSIREGRLPSESEILTAEDRRNEYLITGLRTRRGLSRERLLREFGLDLDRDKEERMEEWKRRGWIVQEGDRFALTNLGMWMSDQVVLELMEVREGA